MIHRLDVDTCELDIGTIDAISVLPVPDCEPIRRTSRTPQTQLTGDDVRVCHDSTCNLKATTDCVLSSRRYRIGGIVCGRFFVGHMHGRVKRVGSLGHRKRGRGVLSCHVMSCHLGSVMQVCVQDAQVL